MPKLLLISVLTILSIPAFAWIGEARTLFFQFNNEGCKSSELYDILMKQGNNNQALYNAYLGTALATSASCTSSPVAKLRRFRDGRQLIEKAVENDQNHPEIRLLRLSVQSNAPSFLNYSSDIDVDRRFVLHSIQQGNQVWDDADFKLKVLKFVREFGKPEADELSLIDKLMTKN
jgi:hypothetical protein